MENGVKVIRPITDSRITQRDLLFALFKDLGGCSVSNMPDEVEGNKSYSDNWEYFNPTEVEDATVLPEYWRIVYNLHNRKDMKDCRDLHYRYIHCPIDIMPRYPRVPCKGIFCLCNNNIKWNAITSEDLIHIGNEFED